MNFPQLHRFTLNALGWCVLMYRFDWEGFRHSFGAGPALASLSKLLKFLNAIYSLWPSFLHFARFNRYFIPQNMLAAQTNLICSPRSSSISYRYTITLAMLLFVGYLFDFSAFRACRTFDWITVQYIRTPMRTNSIEINLHDGGTIMLGGMAISLSSICLMLHSNMILPHDIMIYNNQQNVKNMNYVKLKADY